MEEKIDQLKKNAQGLSQAKLEKLERKAVGKKLLRRKVASGSLEWIKADELFPKKVAEHNVERF